MGDRRAGAVGERARVNVTRAIRPALERIEDLSPDLGRHPSQTIRTGTFCSYEPGLSIGWDVGGSDGSSAR